MRAEAVRIVVGHDEAFQQMVVAPFAGGHVLLKGVPGTTRGAESPESLAACRAIVRAVTVDESVMA
jgi:hypothetical protein